MNRNHRIEMIFYSHPWNLHLLGKEQIIDPSRNVLLVEVSDAPHLSILCPEMKTRSVGVLPLLRRPTKLKLSSLANRYPLIDAPLILAPNPARPLQLVVDSLLLLDVKEDEYDDVILLCHISHAPKFSQLLPICDSFRMLWDAADYPGNELIECASVLKGSGCLDQESWGGFNVCNHWLRSSEDSAINSNLVREAVMAAGL